MELGGNNISDAGAGRIAAALVNNSTLATFGLRSNDISAAGAEWIAAALEKNATLTNLDSSCLKRCPLQMGP